MSRQFELVRTLKALVIGTHDWRSPFQVGTHYISRFLVELGFEVAYVSAPVTPLHKLLPGSESLHQRWANNASGGVTEREAGGRLWHYVPFALIAPDTRWALRSSLVLNHWHSLSIPNLVKSVRRAGFADVDLLFMSTAMQPFWLSAVRYKASAYRLADNTSGFSGASRSIGRVEKSIISQVDMTFVASRELKEYAAVKGARAVEYLANGVDTRRFTEAKIGSGLDLPSLSGPVAIYVGAIGGWFDHQAIVQLASARPDVNILLIGPVESGAKKYTQLSNVHLIGAVPAKHIPACLMQADIGLIPFNLEKYPTLINDVNPLKLYEYMAAGLPVVSFRWRTIEQLKSPATLVDSRQDFVNAVSSVLEHDNPGERERAFANQFDWKQTLGPLANWVESMVGLPGGARRDGSGTTTGEATCE